MVKIVGKPTTPNINSRIVLPFEILATNTATKAAQAANHKLKNIGFAAAQASDDSW